MSQEKKANGTAEVQPEEETPPKPDNFDVEDLMERIEYACEHHRDQLTQERINRVFSAFSEAQP